MKTLQEIVAARLAEINRGPGTAERIGGLGKNYVSDIVRGEKRDVRSAYLPRLAKALDWTPEELRHQIGAQSNAPGAMTEVDASSFERLPLDVPVLGVAAASVAGAFVVDGEIDRVRRPPGLTHAKNVYALYVRGDSMSPRYRPGELIFVSPDRPAGAGDDVVVQTRNHPGAPLESWLKEYVRSDGATIHARQLNPPAAVDFKSDHVVAVHRVLTMRELFGS